MVVNGALMVLIGFHGVNAGSNRCLLMLNCCLMGFDADLMGFIGVYWGSDSGLMGVSLGDKWGVQLESIHFEIIRCFKKCSRSEKFFTLTALSVKISVWSMTFAALVEYQGVFMRV